MKGYNISNKFGQQRKSSFVEPLSESKRKLALEREGSTREGRAEKESSTSHIFSQPPFPHVHEAKKYPFKLYDNIPSSANNSTKSLNKKYQKRDTPKRLPKLENVSGTLKLTSKTEVIEITAEKPKRRSISPTKGNDLTFQVHKMEVANPHSYYSKLPTLSSLGLNSSPPKSIPPTINNNAKTNENKHYTEDSKQIQDFKQVQDNIQVLATMHKQHHVNTKNKINKINYNNSNYTTEDIAPTIQNLQEIENIQENIHQTQSLLQGLQHSDSFVVPRPRNSTEYGTFPVLTISPIYYFYLFPPHFPPFRFVSPSFPLPSFSKKKKFNLSYRLHFFFF